MSFRVTQRSIAAATTANLQSSLTRTARLQNQLSSGKSVSKPSDSPLAAGSAMQLRTAIRAQQQFQRNADDGIGWLSTVDKALSSTTDSMRRARSLVIGAANVAVGTADTREAIAQEILSIKQSLVGTANTQYLGRPVFGGTTSGKDAFDPSGAYLGDGGPVLRRLDTNTTVRVDGDAAAAFGSGASGLFALLDKVVDDLRNNPAAVGANISAIDTAMARVTSAQTAVGGRYSQIEQLRQKSEDGVLELRSTLAQTEDIDIPSTIVDLQLQQTAYQAALGATAKVLQPSLLDFLR